MAITYALCCLFFSALNDFVFKLFANCTQSTTTRKSCGLFVTIVGMVWFLALAWLPRQPETSLQATILWGCVSGAFSISSNVLLIESMAFLSAGVSSTIFRLNMVLVVIGAFLFLGEPLTTPIVIGILCAFAAILAFIPSKKQQSSSHVRLGFTLACLACLLRAGMGFFYKYGFNHQADPNLISSINALFWVFGGPLYTLIREHKLSLPTRHELVIGGVSGLFVAGIVFFMARMNAYGNASVVNPIAQMSFLGTFLLSVLFLKEKLSPRKIIAVLLGLAAILCLTVKF